MKRATVGFLLALLAWLAPAGRAQELEFGASAGYSSAHTIDPVASDLDGAAVRPGFTWAAQLAWSFRPRWAAELSFTQQRTAFELDVAGQPVDLFTLQIGRLHGNFVYRLRGEGARVVPYLLAGAGVALMSAHDVDTQAKLSWGAGGGVKVGLGRGLGLRLQARFVRTQLGDGDDDVACLPFGFCQDSLNQAELTAGVVVRF